MTKMISLTEADNDHTWFATGVLFTWAADFVRARVDDPELREELGHDAESGYLWLGRLPEPHRTRVLTALRDELPAAVDHDLYPPPLRPRDRVFAARAKRLAGLAGDICPLPSPSYDVGVTAAKTSTGWWIGLSAGRCGSRAIVSRVLDDCLGTGRPVDDGAGPRPRTSAAERAGLLDLAESIKGVEEFTDSELRAVQAVLNAYADPRACGSDEAFQARLGLSRTVVADLAANLTRAVEGTAGEGIAW